MWTSRVALTFAACGITVGCSDGARGGTTRGPAVAVATTKALPAVTSASLPVGPAVPSKLLGPFTIDSAKYTVELMRYAVSGDSGVSRIVIRDSTRRAVYTEDLAGIVGSDPDSWANVSADVLEDAARHPRALLLVYSVFPSAPGTGESFRFVAPRTGRVQALTPMIDDAGNTSAGPAFSLVAGQRPASKRLLEGNRMKLYRHRGYFGAIIPVRIDLGCPPGAESCVVLALTDSVDGLARIDVDATPGDIPTTDAVSLFARPDSTTTADRVPIVPGDKVEVLGGAARVVIGRDAGNLSLRVRDEWLHIRVNGFTGWIHGETAFELIGLHMAG